MIAVELAGDAGNDPVVLLEKRCELFFGGRGARATTNRRRKVGRLGRRRWHRARPSVEPIGKMLDADEVLAFGLRELGRALHRLLETAHVVRPRVQAKRLVRANFEAEPRPVAEEMSGERSEVLEVLLERRRTDRLGANPCLDVGPNPGTRPVGRRPDARVYASPR